MRVTELKLFQFRNISEAALKFSSGINVLYGRNGQGKTNIIEAISFLSATRSFRASQTKELIQWSKDEGSIFAEVEDSLGKTTLGAMITSRNKRFLIDGNEVGAVDIVGKLLAITFSPSDIVMVKGSPSERRRFIDKHLIDLNPQLLSHYLRYQKALKNKVSILKADLIDHKQLDMWDLIIAESLAPLLAAREVFIDQLQQELKECYRSFAEIDGELAIEIDSTIPGSVNVSDILMLLRDVRNKDIAQQRAAIGIHRDDLKISLVGKSSRLYASQGQSKSVAIALKLSVLSLLERAGKERPIVILDDVDSELDRERCQRLYGIVIEKGRQVFITGTEVNEALRDVGVNSYDIEITKFYVENGTARAG